MTIICVTGGRDFTNKKYVFYCLDFIHERRPITKLISGCAKGVDSLAIAWAEERGFTDDDIIKRPPQYNLYGPKKAPLIRNEEMCKLQPDFLAVFPGGTGTAHMVRTAKQYEIPILDFAKGK